MGGGKEKMGERRGDKWSVEGREKGRTAMEEEMGGEGWRAKREKMGEGERKQMS